MNGAPPAPSPRGGGLATAVLLGVTVVALGLFGSLPFPLGGFVGAAGVGLSVLWRTARHGGSPWASVPALLAISIEVAFAPAVTATELLAGASGLLFLVWLADDPARPAGGPGRAAPAVGQVALAVGLALAIAIVGPRGPSDAGIAGGLLAVGVVLLAVLLARSQRRTALTPTEE